MNYSTPSLRPPFDLSNRAFRLEWWIDDELVWSGESSETADGFAYCCEECGHRVWAYKRFPNRALLTMYVSCARHQSSRPFEIPGSLVLWFHDETRAMPDALVEREAEIHLAYYERMTNERDTLKTAA